MHAPVRVTAQILGTTVLSTKAATLEWTADGRVRIMQVEPGEAPVLLLDTPPAALKGVTSYTANQSTLAFKQHEGRNINVSLATSMIAPEPLESADSYARRTAMAGAPPQQWWVDVLTANGVKVASWGARQTLTISVAFVGGLLVLSAIIATLINL